MRWYVCSEKASCIKLFDIDCTDKGNSSHLMLTHSGQVTHICVSNLNTIGSDNGVSPGCHKAIVRTNAGILLIGLLGKNFSEILIEIY